MNKISCNTWKTYSLSELGFLTYHGTRIKKTDRLNGDIIFLTAGKENLGVVGTIGNDIQIWHKPITIDMFGNCFYHDYDCAGDDNIYAFVNDDISDLSKIYISTVINKTTTELYSYTEQFRQNDANIITVNLPAKSNGQPDWDYIDTFMRSIEVKVKDKITMLSFIVDTLPILIQTVEWKEFACLSLFDCKNTGNILSRDVIDGSGKTPFVTASAFNNGVAAYIDASKYDIIEGHCILVGGKTFTITYQKECFVSNDSHNFVIRIKSDAIDDYSYLYLATVIYKYFGQKYSWDDAVTKDRFLKESIPLPSTKKGTPDWDYMAEYMKAIEELVDEKTRLLA